MEKLYKKYESSQFEILGLDAWDGSRKDIAEFTKATGTSFPVLMNASAYIDRLETIDNRGVYLIVGPEGKVLASCDDGYKSYDCFSAQSLDSTVHAILTRVEMTKTRTGNGDKQKEDGVDRTGTNADSSLPPQTEP